MECMVCGKCPSVVTCYREWLRELVRSDECADCHVFLNEKLGMPTHDSYVTMDVNAKLSVTYKAPVIDIRTRRIV